MDREFDVVCIGAGPAGEALTAALAGSALSLAVIEKERVGGECAYWGCMPSKTQIRSAETLTEAGRARELAASRVEWTVDFDKVAKRVKWMTRDLDDAGAAKALEDKGARVVRGTGRLIGPRTVAVEGDRLTARRAVVIATGTMASAPSIPGLSGVDYWTNREAVQATSLPKSLIVMGGGAVGVELGQAFARLGTRVHIVEASDRVVSLEEPEAGAFLGGQLQSEGIQLVTGARIASVEKSGAGVSLKLQSGEPIDAERLLIAAGRRPNTQGFDLEAAGIKATPRGFIQVDSTTLRAGDGIYAAGDINGIGGFTHLADYHGTRVGRAIRGLDSKTDHSAVPRVTFTDPEIGSVGMTERQAGEKGIKVETVSADVGRTARGYIHGEPGGLIKLVADRDRKVLVGATVVSPRAGETLSELSLAIKLQLPISTLDDLVHPFPTFSRVLQWMFGELKSKLEEPVTTPA